MFAEINKFGYLSNGPFCLCTYTVGYSSSQNKGEVDRAKWSGDRDLYTVPIEMEFICQYRW